MRACLSLLFTALFCLAAASGQAAGKRVRLFDGKSFRGWEGDTEKTWRIEGGALVGGSLEEDVPHNAFLCTRRSYGNFLLRLKCKVVGSGFVNAGIQFRSRRIENPPYEMSGYQADMGEGYWGGLYDESRRNRFLAKPDPALIARIVKPDDWNEYEIRCEGKRIRLRLNGQQTVDYTETDEGVETSGVIGVQIHGGGKARASYRDLTLQALP